METSPEWHSNTLVLAVMEQYVNTCREALSTVKMELTCYLGPYAIEVINKCPLTTPPPPPHQPPPRVPPHMPLARGSPPELHEKFENVICEYKQQTAEIAQIEKVRQYMRWVWGWAYYSPMHFLIGPVNPALDCFFRKYEDAIVTFQVSWESLSMKLNSTGTPSSSSSTTSATHDYWLHTIQKFQELKVEEGWGLDGKSNFQQPKLEEADCGPQQLKLEKADCSLDWRAAA